MLELRQKPSELSAFGNCSHNLIAHTLKKQRQRIITLNFITYFSSFKILHRCIKSYVIPTPNRVYSLSIHHFIKKRLKKLEKLKELEKLEIRPNRYNSLHRICVSLSDVYNSYLQERIIRLVQFLNLLFCVREFRSPILTTLHICKIINIQTTPNQWIQNQVKDTKVIIFSKFL